VSVQGELKHTVNHRTLGLHCRSSAALAVVRRQQNRDNSQGHWSETSVENVLKALFFI